MRTFCLVVSDREDDEQLEIAQDCKISVKAVVVPFPVVGYCRNCMGTLIWVHPLFVVKIPITVGISILTVFLLVLRVKLFPMFTITITISGIDRSKVACEQLRRARRSHPRFSVGILILSVIVPKTWALSAFPVSAAVVISGCPPASHLFDETYFELVVVENFSC